MLPLVKISLSIQVTILFITVFASIDARAAERPHFSEMLSPLRSWFSQKTATGQWLGFRDRKAGVSLAASLVASVFCFVALAGESRAYLAAAMIIMLGVFIFYVGKTRDQAKSGA
jgi:hypothetical protein